MWHLCHMSKDLFPFARKGDRRYLAGAGCPASPYELTQKGLNAVKDCVSKGGGKAALVRLLRVDRETIGNLIERDPRMQVAIDEGTAEYDAYLTSQIEKIGESEKQWSAFLALGKVKLGWREGDAPDHLPRPSPVQVNIQLVQPAAPGDLAKLVGELDDND